MKFGLHALSFHQISGESLGTICRHLSELGHEIFASQSVTKSIEKAGISLPSTHVFGLGDPLANLDVFLSLGGDGTVLDSLLYAVPNQIPVLGINFGRLGFLATAQATDFLKVIHEIQQKQFSTEERALIELRSPEQPEIFSPFNFALNEISITKRDTASMITIKTHVNGDFLNEYWGDGLIVSTATGSTGYSLSCGGPILIPESKGLVINPISPHNLSMRPLVLPEDAEIELTPTGRSQKVMLSMDSRSKAVTRNLTYGIKVSQQKALLVRLAGSSFTQTLRDKLFWGKDLRN